MCVCVCVCVCVEGRGGREANLKSLNELSADEMSREGSRASRLTQVR